MIGHDDDVDEVVSYRHSAHHNAKESLADLLARLQLQAAVAARSVTAQQRTGGTAADQQPSSVSGSRREPTAAADDFSRFFDVWAPPEQYFERQLRIVERELVDEKRAHSPTRAPIGTHGDDEIESCSDDDGATEPGRGADAEGGKQRPQAVSLSSRTAESAVDRRFGLAAPSGPDHRNALVSRRTTKQREGAPASLIRAADDLAKVSRLPARMTAPTHHRRPLITDLLDRAPPPDGAAPFAGPRPAPSMPPANTGSMATSRRLFGLDGDDNAAPHLAAARSACPSATAAVTAAIFRLRDDDLSLHGGDEGAKVRAAGVMIQELLDHHTVAPPPVCDADGLLHADVGAAARPGRASAGHRGQHPIAQRVPWAAEALAQAWRDRGCQPLFLREVLVCLVRIIGHVVLVIGAHGSGSDRRAVALMVAVDDSVVPRIRPGSSLAVGPPLAVLPAAHAFGVDLAAVVVCTSCLATVEQAATMRADVNHRAQPGGSSASESATERPEPAAPFRYVVPRTLAAESEFPKRHGSPEPTSWPPREHAGVLLEQGWAVAWHDLAAVLPQRAV